MRRLRLITFDLDNTLWPVGKVIPRAEAVCSDWLRQKFPEHRQALTVESLLVVRGQVLKEHPNELHSLTGLRIRCIREALLSCGVAPGQAAEAAAEAFSVFHAERNQVALFVGVKETLARLKEEFFLGALTNGNADLHKIGISHLFDFHHSSETIGVRKPGLDMFHAALTSAKVGAHESLHVGDHPLEDVEAARRAGFIAVWVAAPEAIWPVELEPPAWTIRHVPELEALLRNEAVFPK